MKPSNFPQDPWKITESSLDTDNCRVAETLFALANGYIGTRGTFEEGLAGSLASTEGTYLNGVFLREKIHYDEWAHGFASHNNKMVLVPNGKQITLTAGDETFVPGKSRVEGYERSLDLKSGILTRKLRWRLAGGGRLSVRTRRLVSLARPNILALEYVVSSLDYTGPLKLVSGMDAAYGAAKAGTDPRAGELSIDKCLDKRRGEAHGERGLFLHQVKGGGPLILSEFQHGLDWPNVASRAAMDGDDHIAERIEGAIKPGQTITLTKYVHYAHADEGLEVSLEGAARHAVSEAKGAGFVALVAEQEKALAAFWASADMRVDGAVDMQQGMRFNLFHLFQSAGKDGHSSIGAKGLTGPGYDGHYFWDTEIYIVPYFVFTYPDIAKKLLEYRYNCLDRARERAREMAHEKGALFSWRTIGGEECSSYFPAGTAQYHINAAVAYAVEQYFDVTGDWRFMQSQGAELLFETARIWMDLGHFSTRHGGKFCIHEVTGPDEYTAMVDNNLYTNAMARHNLESACRAAAHLRSEAPARYAELAAKISLADGEVEGWRQAAAQMYLPYDEELKIHAQDDSFLNKPKWDFDNTPADKYPLLLHYHPLVIYRHQVLKQADVILAMILLSGRFAQADKRRNLDYYAPLTTHDSTLSACIYSVAHAEMGNKADAYALFTETVRMDLENRHANTEHGVHAACMAGSWMCVVYGFAGMRLVDGRLTFSPYLPAEWREYSFLITFRQRRIAVTVSQGQACYELRGGEAVEVRHAGRPVLLEFDEPVTFQL
ncbi:MAG: glycoside hydrolase family 65 protein [Sphingomonadales bacterium]